MAQSGFSPILIYGSTTTGNTPSASNLTTTSLGVELAINATDGKLFYKDNAGNVQTLATKATGTIGGSNTQVQYNSSGSLAGSANLTFNGTTLTLANDASISGLTVGRGLNSLSLNTVVGANSLNSITTGNENSAFGTYALTANTSGAYNASFGNYALSSNTTGVYNVGIGRLALGSNISGGSNVAIGVQALTSNTTASNNTAVGYQAGYSNTTGAYNTFIGEGTGYANTTGTQNVYIGNYSSGSLTTTGSYNCIFGNYNGNSYGLDIRTASGYIVLSDGYGNPRQVIDSSGNLLVGTTSQIGSGKSNLAFDGQAFNGFTLKDTNATLNGNFIAFYNSAGTNCGSVSHNGTTTVNYITSSDYRLKENVAPMTGALAKVSALKPVTYTWKDTDNETGEGFIAHELQEVCPLAVSGEKDAMNEDGSIKAQGIDPSKLVAILTAAIQELKLISDEQTVKLEAQAVEIATLKGQ